MNYADIKQCDAANGPGIRISIFVSGCTHACKGCFNEVAWDFNYGEPFTDKELEFIIESCRPSHIAGLSVLGGEPMDPRNQPGILPLLRRFREEFGHTKTIWLWTGYLFDRDVLGNMAANVPETKELLSYLDVVMDGPYVEELKDLSAYFRGSSNQRAIDVPATLAANGELVFWEPQKPKYVYANT